MTKRRSFSDNFKPTVALEALRGDKTAQGLLCNSLPVNEKDQTKDT